MMYLEDIYDTGHYYVESAIWLTWEEKVQAEDPDGELPQMTLPIWQGLCSKAAFGSITDPLRYFAMMQDKAFNDSVHQEPAYVYRNLMWCLVFFYVALWRVEVWIGKLPFFGLLYFLFMFMVIDMSKIYGLISMIYWLEYCDVSPVISSWMPRDPYVLAKRLSAWQLKLIPLAFARWMPMAGTSGLIGAGCEQFAKLFNRLQAVKPLAGHGVPIDNPWTGDAHRMMELLADPERSPDNAIVLNSETGTGKSALGTDAVHRLVRHSIDGSARMWVFVPTRILLKDPMPSFLQRGQDNDPEHSKTYQVLRKGITIRGNAEILFMTYGHGLNRLRAGEFADNDTAFVDEMHMLSAEQRLVCHELKGKRIIFASATTVPPPGFTAPVFRSSQKKKWKAYERIFPATTNVASMFQRAQNDTEPVMGMKHAPSQLADRTLILCATFKEVDQVMESLITLRKSVYGAGIGVTMPPVVEVSSRIKPGTTDWDTRQTAFLSGKYIAIGTKQAATGFDIKPHPPWLLIDGGEDIYSHEGSIVKLPTTPQDDEQRRGRVTRNSSDRDGLVYKREQAGTRAWTTLEYPSVSYCVEPIISTAYNLGLLLPVENPAVDQWPYFEVRQDLQSHVKEALNFLALASCSSVPAPRLNEFYMRHWVQQIPLSEDYEWMDSILTKSGRKTVISAPAWVTMESILAQNPIGWNTTGMQVDDTRTQPISSSSHLVWGNLLYPVAGRYLSFQEARDSRGTRIRDYTSQENRAEDIAADIIAKQRDAIDTMTRALNRLRQKPKDNQALAVAEQVNADQVQKTRTKIRNAVRDRLQGRTPNKMRGISNDLIKQYQKSERTPAAPFTGDADMMSQSCGEGEGWGYCSIDGTAAVIGESGPQEGITPTMSCGHECHGIGDHIIAPSFVVVKRGPTWTSKYKVENTQAVINRIMMRLTEEQILANVPKAKS